LVVACNALRIAAKKVYLCQQAATIAATIAIEWQDDSALFVNVVQTIRTDKTRKMRRDVGQFIEPRKRIVTRRNSEDYVTELALVGRSLSSRTNVNDMHHTQQHSVVRWRLNLGMASADMRIETHN
jgi:hypothetical protein